MSVIFISARPLQFQTNSDLNTRNDNVKKPGSSDQEDVIIIKWLSLKNTIEYVDEWEAIYNPGFNYTEFDTIKNAAGGNNFVLSVKQWIERTGALGLTAKAGRYGGTYAHKDIAFYFGMWISPKFQLLLVKEYQRL